MVIYMKSFKNIPLRNKFIIIVILTVFIPMLIMLAIISNHVKNTMIERATQVSESEVKQISGNISSMITSQVVNISELLIRDPDLYRLVTEPYTAGKTQKYIDTNDFKDKVDAGYGRVYSNIGVAAVYGVNGVLYNFTLPAYETEEVISLVEKIKEATQNYGVNIYWDGLYKNIFTSYSTDNPRKDNMIIAAMNIYNPKSGEYLGVQIFTFLEKEIYSQYKDMEIANNGSIFILNVDGKLLSSNIVEYVSGEKKLPAEYVAAVLKEPDFTLDVKNERILTNHVSSLNLWCTIGEFPKSYITRDINNFFNFVWIVLLGGLLVSLIGFSRLILQIINPIKNLTNSMEKFVSGEMKSYVESSGADELELLEGCYNKLIDRINHQIVYEYELDKQKHQFHYDLLISQINSHFLSNALESIVWEAHSIGADNVAKMAVELGKLFRLSCKNTDMFVTVEDEIKHINAYVAVQKLRHGDDFNFTLKTEGDVKGLKTLKILLQPLVENAIIHAFDKSKSALNIDVKIHIENNQLIFEVKDDGIGMSEEQLNVVRKNILSDEVKSRGIGLGNVRKRIKLYFEAEHPVSDLTISSEEGAGTNIRLLLPVIP